MQLLKQALLTTIASMSASLYLTNTASADGWDDLTEQCRQNITGLCEAYCGSLENCDYHIENEATCLFHVDECTSS